MVQDAAIFDGHGTPRTRALQVPVVRIFAQGHFLHEGGQL